MAALPLMAGRLIYLAADNFTRLHMGVGMTQIVFGMLALSVAVAILAYQAGVNDGMGRLVSWLRGQAPASD